MDDALIWFGGEVKALDEKGKVGGHLVLFGSVEQTDATAARDFFTKETDFDRDFPSTVGVRYRHGFDVKMGTRKIGRGQMGVDDAGLWIEAQLAMRDEYEEHIYSLVRAGKLGWSSGSAAHMVEREPIKQNGRIVAHRVLQWPIAEASLTPNPGEPRNVAVALKSLLDPPAETPGLFVDDLKDLPDFDALSDGESRLRRETRALCVGVPYVIGQYRTLESYAAKEGRALSAARRSRLEELLRVCEGGMADLRTMLEETTPKPKGEEDALSETAALMTEYLRRGAALRQPTQGATT